MKKRISQISLIVLIVLISMTFATVVFAEDATLAVSSNVKKGEKYTVTVNIPSNAVGYQGIIKVTYSDKTTDTSGMLANFGFNNGNFTHPGNMTATFTAKAAGSATITLEECVISDANNASMKVPGSISFNIAEPTPVQPSQPTQPSTPSTPSQPSQPSTPSTPSQPSQPSTQEKPNTQDGPKFSDVNETVYTTTRCNLRESYSTSSNKVATVSAETKLTRKGIGDNGWSKCEYNGKTVYVSSQYLTTTAPNGDEDKKDEDEKEKEEVVFKDTKENLYAKQSCNLRASWSTDSEKVGYLLKGQPVERTGYAENGWSRILYEGKTVYVASRLLVVEKPEEDEVENTVENEVIDSTLINENIAVSEEEMLNIIKEEVGVLPEVGTNAASVAYVIVTLIAMSGIVAGIIYTKKIK